MKDAGKSIWNLSLLSKMTGISRPTLRKCRDEGFAHRHGNKGRKRASKLDGHTQLLDEKLKSGITNSDVLLSVLRKAGYEGGLTTIKTYVAKNHAPAIQITGKSYRLRSVKECVSLVVREW